MIDEVAGKLGELTVVSHKNADRAAIGIDYDQLIAPLDIPPESLIGCGMYLVLACDTAVAQKDMRNIIDLAIAL